MKKILVPVLVAVLCAMSMDARAQDDDADVTRMAKEHYKVGLEAYKAGKFDVAIKELKKAYLLKRLPQLLLNIGATYRKMGDLDMSLHFYSKYLDEAPADAPYADFIRSEIVRVAGAPDPAAMVARLAERIQHDGSNVLYALWLTLVRSYVVLGDRDKAKAAAADARRALAADPEKLRQIEELAKELGIGG